MEKSAGLSHPVIQCICGAALNVIFFFERNLSISSDFNIFCNGHTVFLWLSQGSRMGGKGQHLSCRHTGADLTRGLMECH